MAIRSVRCCIALVVACYTLVHADLPVSLPQFRQELAQKATDPRTAAKLWFDALLVYSMRDEVVGERLITEMMARKDWTEDKTLRDRLLLKSYIFRSYIVGAQPENAYTIDPENYALQFDQRINLRPYGDRPAGMYVQLWLKTSGSRTPRPLTLVKAEGARYEVYDCASIYVDVRPPSISTDANLAESKEPAWVLRRLFEGIFTYTDGDRDKGLQLINSVLAVRPLPPGSPLEGHLQHEPWQFGGFVKGTRAEDCYRFDRAHWELDLARPIAKVQHGQQTRAFVKYAGSDSPRVIPLLRDSRGQYRIDYLGNLYSGAIAPNDQLATRKPTADPG